MLFLVDSTSIPAPEIDPSLSTGSFTGTPIKPGSDVILCSLSPASTSVSSSQLAKVAIEGTWSTVSLGLTLSPTTPATTLHTIIQYRPELLPPNFDFDILSKSPPLSPQSKPSSPAPTTPASSTLHPRYPNTTTTLIKTHLRHHPKLSQILLDVLLFLPLPTLLLPILLPPLLNLPETLSTLFFSPSNLSFLANNPLGIKMNPELSTNLSNELSVLVKTSTELITSLLPPPPKPSQALFLLAPLGLSTTLAIATDLLFLLTLPTRLAYFLCRAISLSTLWLLKSLYKLTTSVKANPLRERTDTYAGGEMELLLVVTSLVILLFLVTTVTTFHAYTFASYSVAEALRFSLESLLTVLLASFDALFNKDFNAIPRYSVSYTLMVPGMYKLHGSKLSKLARFILLCKRQSKSSKSNE
ncbi:hypothetical protein TL16_g07550 [Triparma laevis f. inornata]|uniref:Uncharacterized protein n=1 Tax=Triparma laevis f. inornata TaxID=1714386 RepID=A0A9W7B1I1_9STRA|nr:hypothetical protein TL16_g07550 [Triparma laevis f. inornata]